MGPDRTDGVKPDPARPAYRFLIIAFELALVLLAVHLFKIEEQRSFLVLMGLAAGGFVVHAWLPMRFRLAFFCLLSLAAVVLLLGWRDGAWVLGIGGGLIGTCYLPVPLLVRVALLAVVGLFLTVARVEHCAAAFWPVLGAMFMFRLIVYLYDTRHERRRPPLLQSLAYFLSLPNVSFTLFPVIDFKTFRQTYYDEDAFAIYQAGVAGIVRGLSHLLAYRYVKYYLLPAPHELRDLPHLALFLAANYALYLRVSGWFHLITGILHLFGFNLPRTHYHYFLASSFTDIWRRINIYWKDFMTKVFFLPAFFRLRGMGTPVALTVAGLWVFLATWLLHSYQVFWLLGELPVAGSELVLWLIAGALVAVNLRLDLRRASHQDKETGRQGDKESRPFSLSRLSLSLRVVGMFILVSYFWACWTMPGFARHLGALTGPDAMPADGLKVAAVVGAVVAAGAVVQLARDWLLRRGLLPLPASFARSAVLQTAALAALVVAGIPAAGAALGPWAGDRLATLRLDSPTAREAVQVVRGYYEELADVSLQATPLLGGSGQGAKRAGARYTAMTRPADDFLERELIPG